MCIRDRYYMYLTVLSLDSSGRSKQTEGILLESNISTPRHMHQITHMDREIRYYRAQNVLYLPSAPLLSSPLLFRALLSLTLIFCVYSTLRDSSTSNFINDLFTWKPYLSRCPCVWAFRASSRRTTSKCSRILCTLYSVPRWLSLLTNIS